jgi:hypothetical protein
MSFEIKQGQLEPFTPGPVRVSSTPFGSLPQNEGATSEGLSMNVLGKPVISSSGNLTGNDESPVDALTKSVSEFFDKEPIRISGDDNGDTITPKSVISPKDPEGTLIVGGNKFVPYEPYKLPDNVITKDGKMYIPVGFDPNDCDPGMNGPTIMIDGKRCRPYVPDCDPGMTPSITIDGKRYLPVVPDCDPGMSPHIDKKITPNVLSS